MLVENQPVFHSKNNTKTHYTKFFYSNNSRGWRKYWQANFSSISNTQICSSGSSNISHPNSSTARLFGIYQCNYIYKKKLNLTATGVNIQQKIISFTHSGGLWDNTSFSPIVCSNKCKLVPRQINWASWWLINYLNIKT